MEYFDPRFMGLTLHKYIINTWARFQGKLNFANEDVFLKSEQQRILDAFTTQLFQVCGKITLWLLA